MPRLAAFVLALSLVVALPVAAQNTPLPPLPPAAFLPFISKSAATAPANPTPTQTTTLPGSTNNLAVTTASYLGGSSADSVRALTIAPDGSLLVGGTFPGFSPAGISPVSLLGGGNGAIVRLNAAGRQILGLTRIGASVADMEQNAAGQLVVCGDFGVALLSADAASLRWNATPGDVARCSIGGDGTVAALVGKNVSVYSSTGAALGSWAVGGTTAYDLAVDALNSQVVAVGYTQVSGNLQQPFMRGYSYAGAQKWKSYDWSAAQAGGLGADTRAERVVLGADGKLYLAGSINGGTGVSTFSRDPKNVALALGSRAVNIDNYTQPTNIGSVKMAWFGRFNPADGALELSQSILTRLSSGKGNSIGVSAIAADAQGRVFIGGGAACCIKNRPGDSTPQQLSVGGVTVGSYEGSEGYLLALSADLKTRLAWTVFAAPGTSAGGSPIESLAVRDGKVALGATLNQNSGATRRLITYQPLQAQPASTSTSEGYFVLWPVP